MDGLPSNIDSGHPPGGQDINSELPSSSSESIFVC